ncbi:phage major tail protein, TP901-1 family [Streptococcus uberis]|uniref:phage major tail protein, TP901-1 family n=1 Tax=Streptococcus uberis TaxID=1349 RepID=UPI0019394A76|nr:phage major tail protein, TP901-1 family [Streptococcus uberis]
MATTIDITKAKPIVGKKVFYFIQSVDAVLGSKAILPAYRTDGTTTMGGDFIDEQTQQGRVLEKATDEHSIELTSYYTPLDKAIEVVEEAKRTGKSVKVWRVIADESLKTVDETTQKDVYPAKFGYGKVDEIEYSEGVEDFVEANYALNIIDSLKDGKFPLTAEDIALLTSVYAYQNPGETTGDYDAIKTAPAG